MSKGKLVDHNKVSALFVSPGNTRLKSRWQMHYNIPPVLLAVACGESGIRPQMTASAVSLYDFNPSFSALDICLEPKKFSLDRRTCTE